MNEIALNEEELQSLKTSLLGFVRRVAFHGAEQPDETTVFFLVVNLLLADSRVLDFALVLDSEKWQESENSGYKPKPEPSCVADWRCKNACPSC